MDQDSSIWDFRQIKTEKSSETKDSLYNAYELNYSDKEGEKTSFFVTLFTLKDSLYFDFYPIENESDNSFFIKHTVSVHTLAKVKQIDKNNFHMKWFSEEWLNELIDSTQLNIAHEIIRIPAFDILDNPNAILTATTADLQKFLITHMYDPKAFDCEGGYCRELVKISD